MRKVIAIRLSRYLTKPPQRLTFEASFDTFAYHLLSST